MQSHQELRVSFLANSLQTTTILMGLTCHHAAPTGGGVSLGSFGALSKCFLADLPWPTVAWLINANSQEP